MNKTFLLVMKMLTMTS